jgi:hypothetical protein
MSFQAQALRFERDGATTGKRIEGSGSPKEASSFQVVAMEKEAQASFMHEKRF